MKPAVIGHRPPKRASGGGECFRLLRAAVLLLLAGCAAGPDFQPPPAPSGGYAAAPPGATAAAPGVIAGGSQQFVSELDIPAEWWTIFHSPALNALVTRALKRNPDLQAAQAALRQAQQLYLAQRGSLLPQVGASYNFERQQLAGNLGGNSPGIQGNGSVIQTYQNPGGPAPFNGPVTFNFHTAEVSVGYALDVFGLNRRTIEAAGAQTDQARWALTAARLTLSTNVVAAAIQEASLRAQIAAARAIIASQAGAVRIVRAQFAKGYAGRLDVAAQEAQLAQAEAVLPQLLKQLAQQRDLLAVLAGAFPGDPPAETFELAGLKLPEELPLSLPSRLVEQRPDVRQAEAAWHGACAQVGAAEAARLPQFTLSGAYGGTASKFNEMFAPGGPYWNLIGNLAEPLFAGGALAHRQRAAEAALEQAAALYRSTVLTAFQNVADTLHALEQDAAALKAAAAAEAATKVTRDLTHRQAQVGYAGYLALAAAEQAYQAARINLAQAQAARLADTAALFQALGGGWWSRTGGLDEAQNSVAPSSR